MALRRGRGEPKAPEEKRASVGVTTEQKVSQAAAVKSAGVSTFAQLAQSFSKAFISSSHLEFLDTGSVSFNHILGGGLPRGRFVEIFSPSGLGKSTSILHMVKTICTNGGNALIIDAENAINESLVEGVGLTQFLDSQLLITKAFTYDQADDLLTGFFTSTQPPDVVVLDSITSLIPSKLLEKKVEEIEPGLISRLQSSFLQKYKAPTNQKNCCFIFVNQMRTKINFNRPSTLDAAGGEAMKFYMDVRIKMSKANDIEEDGQVIGYDLAIETIKNKVTRPFVKNVLSVIFGKGISNIRACTFLLEAEGVVKQSGSSFYVKIGDVEAGVRGRVGLEGWIRDNEKLVLDYLRNKGRI